MKRYTKADGERDDVYDHPHDAQVGNDRLLWVCSLYTAHAEQQILTRFTAI